jgi:hypothetical protein
MASRNFGRYQALEKEVKSLFADVAIGATGAPTLTKGLGVASIARTATGDYTITLDDKYVRLMHVSIMQVEADDEDLTFQVSSEDVDGAKTIGIICKAAATPADPSNGSRLLIRIDLKNSTSGE